MTFPFESKINTALAPDILEKPDAYPAVSRTSSFRPQKQAATFSSDLSTSSFGQWGEVNKTLIGSPCVVGQMATGSLILDGYPLYPLALTVTVVILLLQCLILITI